MDTSTRVTQYRHDYHTGMGCLKSRTGGYLLEKTEYWNIFRDFSVIKARDYN